MQAAASSLGCVAREDAPHSARLPRISAADGREATEMVLVLPAAGPSLEPFVTGPSVPVIDRDGTLAAAGGRLPRARRSFQGVAW
jgi:hypothetical protein